MTDKIWERHLNNRSYLSIRFRVWRDIKRITWIIIVIVTLLHFTMHQANAKTATESSIFIPTILQYLTPTEKPSMLISPIPTEDQIIDTPTRWSKFEAAARRIAGIYNYPVNVILAQAHVESAQGTSQFAIERNNYFGIGAYDSNPDNAFWYENPEQCIIDYLLLIRTNFPEAWANRDNPAQLVHLLENNSNGLMYATDPDYESKIMSQPEWEEVK